MKSSLRVGLVILAIVVAAGTGFIYGGIFNVAADEPHWGLTLRFLEATREQSIAVHARGIGKAPQLNEPALIAAGAREYAEMCTGCHLAPGMKETEIRAGLYPKPPNLIEHGTHRSPEQTFWIIKHGLKMTGMPAWGRSHDDARIWSMVAFLRKLPELSPEAYHELVADQAGGDSHSHRASQDKDDHDGERYEHDNDPWAPGASAEHVHSQVHTDSTSAASGVAGYLNRRKRLPWLIDSSARWPQARCDNRERHHPSHGIDFRKPSFGTLAPEVNVAFQGPGRIPRQLSARICMTMVPPKARPLGPSEHPATELAARVDHVSRWRNA